MRRKVKTKRPLTETQQKYLNLCVQDFQFFCANELKIVTKQGELVPFLWNEPQQEVWKLIHAGRIRLGVLKARQMGMSTFIAAYFFWRTQFQPNTKCVVLAHEDEPARMLFGIYKTYYENQSEWIQAHFPLKHSTRIELVFAGSGSYIRIATAKNPDKLRSRTVQLLHCSEVAFWVYQKEVMTAAMQALTDKGLCFVETTANSFNHFYKWWQEKSAYEKVFLPWHSLSSYRIDKNDEGDYFDAYGEKINLDPISIAALSEPLTADEKHYKKNFQLLDSQLRWRRWCILNKCESDERVFQQEYPASPVEAFLTTGDQFFPGDHIPAEVTSISAEIEPPKAGSVYSIGVDTASGSKQGDYSAYAVVNMTSKPYKIVAWHYDRVPIHKFADRVIEAAEKYNQAIAVIEVNNVGAAVMQDLELRAYPRLYRRYVYDKMAEKYVEKLGFHTSAQTRPLILTRMRRYVADNALAAPPQVLINEMSSFTYNDKGMPDHAPGTHSDMIFAVALALESETQLAGVAEENWQKYKPQTPDEIVSFERETGKSWKTFRPLSEPEEVLNKFSDHHLTNDGLEF
tara:strand:+ start:2545 stop:4257 length:1713 start_codon:yes stop_codon:yes gene_type:complete